MRDGVVASVENLADHPYRPDLADLLLAGSGLPRSLGIDPLPHAIDDEECDEVSALRAFE